MQHCKDCCGWGVSKGVVAHQYKPALEIKPKHCPFCGGKALEGCTPDKDYVIFCPECGASGPKEGSGEEATKLWNMRTAKKR
jgi:Lar family restriction alleviation protein